jgi:CBS domain-containing protein
MRLTPAKAIMSAPVLTIRPDQTIPAAVRLMREHHVSGLPVVEGTTIVGMLSEADIMLKEVGLGGLPELAYMEPARTRQRLQASRVRDLMVRDVLTAHETRASMTSQC